MVIEIGDIIILKKMLRYKILIDGDSIRDNIELLIDGEALMVIYFW